MARGEKLIEPWLAIPFKTRRVGYEDGNGEPHSTNHHRQFVFETLEPHWSRSIPTTFRRFLPTAWRDDDDQPRYRWFDSRTGGWRDVGCRQRAEKTRVLSDSFLTISSGMKTGEWVLQSWPLPPRDPKWPAIAIALISAAAVWRLRTKRAAKRVRMTATT